MHRSPACAAGHRAASTTRCTTSISCCSWPRKSSSPAAQGRGRGLGLPSVTRPARWRPLPGQTDAASRLRRGRLPAAHAALERCYRWQPALGWLSCPGWPHRGRLGGRDPRLPLDPELFQRSTEAISLLIKRLSGSGTAFETSPTSGCGCCAAALGGRRTGPQGCEGAPGLGAYSGLACDLTRGSRLRWSSCL